MPITHLVVFEWRSGTTTEQVEAVTTALRTMAATIESIRAYACGPALGLRPGGLDYGVVAVLDDAAGLEAYLDHPEHVRTVERHIAPILAARHAVQIDSAP